MEYFEAKSTCFVPRMMAKSCDGRKVRDADSKVGKQRREISEI